jgi:hypothetical protein
MGSPGQESVAVGVPVAGATAGSNVANQPYRAGGDVKLQASLNVSDSELAARQAKADRSMQAVYGESKPKQHFTPHEQEPGLKPNSSGFNPYHVAPEPPWERKSKKSCSIM